MVPPFRLVGAIHRPGAAEEGGAPGSCYDDADRVKLFLDIDGVLLGRDSAAPTAVGLARHAERLLRLAVDAFEPWWLTTHGADGTIEPIVRHLSRYCPASVLDLARRVRPAAFRTLKTEALVDAGDFVWLDDAPLAVERRWLMERGLLASWIAVDTRRNPDDLARVIPMLERRLAERR